MKTNNNTNTITLTTVSFKDGRTGLLQGSRRIADYVMKDDHTGNIIVRSVLAKSLLGAFLKLEKTRKSNKGYDKYQFALTNEDDLAKALNALTREFSADDLKKVYQNGKPAAKKAEPKAKASTAKMSVVAKKAAARKAAQTKKSAQTKR